MRQPTLTILAAALVFAPLAAAAQPQPFWHRYSGGTTIDAATAIAVDAGHNIHLAGYTTSHFPFGGPDPAGSEGWTEGGWRTTVAGRGEGFALKLDPEGNHLWSTYIGGSKDDAVWDIAVDAEGNVYLAGTTYSSGWVSGGWNTQEFSGQDEYGFLVRLGPDGEHHWSTYLGHSFSIHGGSPRTGAFGVDVDALGNIVVVGRTNAPDWIPGGPEVGTPRGRSSGFAVKFDPGGGFVWGRYVGGMFTDSLRSVAVDEAGNAFVAGETVSPSDPETAAGEWISGGMRTEWSGSTDGFLMKLHPEGQHLWSTYIGGSSADHLRDIALDPAGNLIAAGMTFHGDWLSGGWLERETPGLGGFAIKVGADGTHHWSTYLGGEADDGAYAVACDPEGNVHLTGFTGSPGWLAGEWGTVDFDQHGHPAFMVMLNPGGEHVWSSYFPWDGIIRLPALAIDSAGDGYLAGLAYPRSWYEDLEDGPHAGDGDAIIVKAADISGAEFWLLY